MLLLLVHIIYMKRGYVQLLGFLYQKTCNICTFIGTAACHWCSTLKGIVDLKMKILSSFTHPQIVSTLYEFLSSVEHKIRYFDEYRY